MDTSLPLDKQAVHLYVEEELGTTRIARQLSLTDWEVRKALDAHGVVRRHKNSYRIRTFPLREDAFSTLDEDAAYWVGFLMADGGIIGRDQDVLKVSQSIKDRQQLVKLNHFLVGGGRRIGDDGQSCWITFVSKRMTTDLAGWGVTARKSLTARPLKGVDGFNSFWRGIFDGDGNIKHTGACRIATASPDIESSYIAFLQRLGCAQPWIYRPPTCASVEIRSTVEDSRVILAALYPPNAAWHLDRKFLRARQLLKAG